MGTTKGAAWPLRYLLCAKMQPETLFQNEFIVQKASGKLWDEREREKEGADGFVQRCSKRDLAFTCKAGRSAGKGSVAREL